MTGEEGDFALKRNASEYDKNNSAAWRLRRVRCKPLLGGPQSLFMTAAFFPALVRSPAQAVTDTE